MINLSDIVVKFGDFEALHRINVHVKEGEFFTFLGPSGCGKTTTLRTITGFIEPAGGTVFMQGKDITHVPIEKRNIGIVFQSYALFPTMTVRDNIAYGRPDASMDEVIAAAKAAYAHDFIMKLPDAYETRVGAGGQKLSGGERQRVSIARTIIQNPKILILDEATAAMDIEGKDLVWTSIRQRMAGKTVVFVAHDAQTVRNADYIIVLRDGKAEAAGDRDTMLASNPYCLEMMKQTGKEAG